MQIRQLQAFTGIAQISQLKDADYFTEVKFKLRELDYLPHVIIIHKY